MHESSSYSLQSSVKTLLPGFGNGWLKYCAKVQFFGGQRNILRAILRTYKECFYTTVFPAVRGGVHSAGINQRVSDALRFLVARHPLVVRVLDGGRGLPGTHPRTVQGGDLLCIP